MQAHLLVGKTVGAISIEPDTFWVLDLTSGCLPKDKSSADVRDRIALSGNTSAEASLFSVGIVTANLAIQIASCPALEMDM